MIGKLKGRIEDYGPDWVTIDVSGVVYHVSCSSKTLAQLPRAKPESADAADALAIAICHAHHRTQRNLVELLVRS